MKRRALWVSLLVLLGLGLVGAATVALAQGEGPPGAHSAISEYTGPETCAMCHPDAAQQVAESVHYQMQSQPPLRVDWPADTPGGMYSTY